LSAGDVDSLLEKAAQAAGGLNGVKTVTFDVNSTESVSQVELSLPAASFKELADSTNAGLAVSTGIGSVTFNAKAVDSIAKAGTGGDVSISIEKLDNASLPAGVKNAVGNRPVYNFTVTSGGKTVSSFGGGKATVSIPYTPASGEDVNNIVIYYISDSGKLTAVPNCKYDTVTGMVTFTTKHFSTYVVGYNAVSFSDVSDGAWYADYVSFLAARGIVGGNNGAFSPDSSITRAEFVTILARMSGDDLIGYTAPSFTDVAASDWYFAAVQWAYANGITTGSDGQFSPNAAITREQLAAMLYRYAQYVGNLSNAEGMSAREFSDYDNISSWAKAPIQWAVNNGIITGNPDGSFAPASNATRAEAAKMIAVLIQSSIG